MSNVLKLKYLIFIRDNTIYIIILILNYSFLHSYLPQMYIHKKLYTQINVTINFTVMRG